MYTWDDFVFEVKVALGVIGVCIIFNWLTTEEGEEWEEEDLGSHRPGVGWGVIPRDTGTGSGTGSGHWWGEHHWENTREEYERWERERYSWEGYEEEGGEEEEESCHTYTLTI